MSKLLKILIPLALVVFIIAPGVTGFLVESSIEKAETGYGQILEKGPFKLVDNSFDRGWFSSDQTVELDLTDPEIASVLHMIGGHEDAADMPSLVIDTKATHGLIPLASPSQGGLRPAIAQTESTLALKYDDGTLITLPVKVYSSLGTGQWARLVAEPLSRTAPDGESTIKWDGADVSASFGNTTTFEGTVGALDIASAMMGLESSPATVKGSMTQTQFAFDEGDSTFSMEKLTLTMPSALGTSSGQPAIVINDVELGGALTLDGDRLVVTSQFNTGAIDNSTLNVIGVEMVSDINIDAEAYSTLVAQANKQSSGDPSDEDSEAIMEALSDLLTKGGRMTYDTFDIEVEGGTMSMDLDLEVPPGSSTPEAAIASGKASGNIVIPESVVEALSAVSPDIANGLGMAAMMGFVQQKDDAYRASVSYENGILLLNELPVPLPF